MCDPPPDPDPTPPSIPERFPGELLVWLSPSFPVGSFAYSQGLEAAVDKGWVTDRATLGDWLEALVSFGALRNDLILMALVLSAADRAEVQKVAELAAVLQPSAERAREALEQGRSFVAAYRAGWVADETSSALFEQPGGVTLPVAVALAARDHALSPGATLEAYAIAFCHNLMSAAIRLGVIGQFDGQRLLAGILPRIRRACGAALGATLDDLGSATYGADLTAMLHETQITRLFRS